MFARRRRKKEADGEKSSDVHWVGLKRNKSSFFSWDYWADAAPPPVAPGPSFPPPPPFFCCAKSCFSRILKIHRDEIFEASKTKDFTSQHRALVVPATTNLCCRPFPMTPSFCPWRLSHSFLEPARWRDGERDNSFGSISLSLIDRNFTVDCPASWSNVWSSQGEISIWNRNDWLLNQVRRTCKYL